jgi:spore germination protein KC
VANYKSLLLTLMLLFALTGCWDRQEINQLAIVMGTGVDYTTEGKIRLTVQIARPSQFGGGGEQTVGFQLNNVWVVSETGETIMDAARQLQTKLPRSIFWHHNIILVVGEEMAKQSLHEAVDFFTCSPEGRETMNVMVTRGKAEELLKSHSQLENTSSQAIASILRAGLVPEVNLRELTMTQASKGAQLALPMVELTPSGIPQGPGLSENILQKDDTKNQQEHAEITIIGLAIFKNDKMLGWLNIPESRGYGWVKNEFRTGVITLPSPKESDKKISIEIVKAKTQIKPYYDGEQIWFDVHIDTVGNLFEQQSEASLNNSDFFNAVEKRMAVEIKEKVELTLEKSRSYGIDIVGFGEVFHRKYPNEWSRLSNSWDEEFVNATINITVDSRIISTGLEKNSVPQRY